MSCDKSVYMRNTYVLAVALELCSADEVVFDREFACCSREVGVVCKEIRRVGVIARRGGVGGLGLADDVAVCVGESGEQKLFLFLG